MSSTSEQKPIRILAVDDHALVRKGIRLLISAESDMLLVAEASTGREALQEFRTHRPDITIMDLQMPEMNGVEAIIAIRGEFPNARVIVLTTYVGDMQVTRALNAGARGYLLKSNISADLLQTIRGVHAGQKRISGEVAGSLAEHAGEEELTDREAQVLRLIAGGNSNKEIAAQLSIGEDTVKRHVTNILAKLQANDRTHAVTIGLKRGIFEL
jgi:DNA-binding NarL/FixJ family response regulator